MRYPPWLRGCFAVDRKHAPGDGGDYRRHDAVVLASHVFSRPCMCTQRYRGTDEVNTVQCSAATSPSPQAHGIDHTGAAIPSALSLQGSGCSLNCGRP